MKSAERSAGGDRIARLEAVEVGCAGSGAAILAVRRCADADVKAELLIRGWVAGHGEIAADRQRILGVKIEDVSCFPNLGKRLIHGDFVEFYFTVCGNVELQVIARLIFECRRAGFGF